MANYQNFKSVIVLNKDPLVKDPTVKKISAVPKSTGTYPTKPVSLEIYTDDKTKGIEYLMLRFPSVVIQTLGKMCSDTKMVRLYRHFVLHGSIILSEYSREACAEHKNWKEGNVRRDRSFAIIMREYKNQLLSSEHAVTAGDVFCSYLQRAHKKPDNMTPNSFKACFKVPFKLYDNLKADFELTIGKKKVTWFSSTPFWYTQFWVTIF